MGKGFSMFASCFILNRFPGYIRKQRGNTGFARDMEICKFKLLKWQHHLPNFLACDEIHKPNDPCEI